MRIYGPTGTVAPAQGQATRRVSGSGFTLNTQEPPRAASEANGPRPVGGIDALLALQGVEDATERRRRAIRRGRSALDSLDALKLGLLGGRLDGLALTRLRTASQGLDEPSGDPRIDSVLMEIALRVEVELAKIGMPNGS